MRPAFALLILAFLAAPAMADPPEDAAAIDAASALACVSARYRGEALRIEAEDDGLVQEIRWLTPAGNVLDIEITGPGCRFLEVDGVGQSEARILPEGAP
ncbi:Cys/Met metabolism pyridoxal-phosphate-dependent enzyme (plasmid) [Cereibacter sphaeroides]|uniref:Cys/Met metabolism pyridoxal-phosphate-dependent enzyme n=1 Tax=Cereibacter sediminicola TaxID=2584941 RepID=UPI000E35E59E|nr:Cys/Met metabolism pyridoxal-phosphate-dependent enzyme [Cereibacter sediminicola]AXQ96254.1 Cys/Met metabolism pyridoxal-phosphate-dependent enzyme [Cereibacter sphaeroides]